MDQLVIRGGNALAGEVIIAGAKNASLPELCAALLTDQPVTLHNVPRLQDVVTMLQLLQSMGVVAERAEDGTVHVNASGLSSPEAPYDLVKTMRASILALGPLVARFGVAKVSMPGGCAIGMRGVDEHIKGLRAMGASIGTEHGYILAKLPPGQKRLHGARVATDMVTVTGTENLMMAAALADGQTVLENAAQEPEIIDLADMLNAMGANIQGQGTGRIVIEGVERLSGCQHTVIADRIEAGTFMCAVAATGGDLFLRNARAEHLGAVLAKLRDAGVRVSVLDGGVRVESDGQLTAQSVHTGPYPGFPTDMQAQFMALNTVARGASQVNEAIFDNRLMHVSELLRLGAKIQTNGSVALIEGVPKLSGATVMATDLRASACLVIAGLVAEGTTVVERIYHLDRGYERMEEKLRAVGANIERVRGPAS